MSGILGGRAQRRDGRACVVIVETDGRATAGHVRSSGGGLGVVVVAIYYNILNFNDKPIGLYGIMLLIFYRDGYGAIRTRPPKKRIESRRRT
jgi:hypothetical protein